MSQATRSTRSTPVSHTSPTPLVPTIPTSQFARWIEDGRSYLLEIAGRLRSLIQSGRASPVQRRTVIGRLIDAGRTKLADVSRSFADSLPKGLSSLGGWSRRFADTMAPQHLAAVMAAFATTDLKPADLQAVSNEVNKQLEWLVKFRDDLKTGRQAIWSTSEVDPETGGRIVSAKFLQRSAMYSDASWGIAQSVVRSSMMRDGFTRERRVLGGGEAERHCKVCPALAKKGWQPIGALPGIGVDSPCRVRCLCHFSYSHPGSPIISPLGSRSN